MKISFQNGVSHKAFAYKHSQICPQKIQQLKVPKVHEESFSVLNTIKKGLENCFKSKDEKLKEACTKLIVYHQKICDNKTNFTLENIEEIMSLSYATAGIKYPIVHYVNANKDEVLEIYQQNIHYLKQNGVKDFEKYLKKQSIDEQNRQTQYGIAMAAVGGRGPGAYVDDELKKKLTCFLSDLNLDESFLNDKKPSEYRDLVFSNLKTYEWNTTQITELLEAFKTMSERFFRHAGQCIEVIMNHKLKDIPRTVEISPVLGIFPKGFRMYEQQKLLKRLMDDYKEITSLYVKEGVVPMMQKFSEQTQELKIYLEDVRNNLKGDDAYLNKKIEEISKIIESRNLVYKQLFEFYATGALNIEKLEKQIKQKNAAEFSLKLISSILCLPST